MTVRRTSTLINGQLAAVRDLLDTGASNGAFQLRSGSKPTSVGDAATGTLLATVVLERPCGTVSAGVLTLIQDADAVAVATGAAAWARWIDGDGQVLFDTDVSIIGGAGEVQLTTVSIEAGMIIPLVSATLG